jgi:glycosyltransferase involved in cell wall biosynthesis
MSLPLSTISNRQSAIPRVSVLMPTYNQAAFIRRALASLLAQSLEDWELVVVDDGSTDETPAVLARYAADSRVRLTRLERNGGLGAALNRATALARGRYLAYLPSDDLYYPDHLLRLADLLDRRPEVGLAYGGVRWGAGSEAPSPRGAGVVGREAEALAEEPRVTKDEPLPSGNILALVQVMHRRDWEAVLRWTERGELVSDTLEADFWRAMLARGARFAYAGRISCEWVSHPEQRHRLIAGSHGGLSRYRRFYGVGRDTWLNFQPTRGMTVDERDRYGRFVAPDATPHENCNTAPVATDRGGRGVASGATRCTERNTDGLTILLAGELGFNPERIVAFEERGHTLYGMWVPKPETWDTTGPLPYAAMEDIPFDRRWAERVREARPDIIYALLNWQALDMVDAILEARLDIPLVFHFKEGPFICIEHGQWPRLVRVLERSDGRVFIDHECLEWFQLATGGALDPATTMILDGDLPKIDWMTDDWAPKLSAADGQIHTVCAGRPLGLDPFEALAAAGIHVHFYGRHFQQWFPNWTRAGLATGYMHLHDTVEPRDWVRELSRYDAGWFHVFGSTNGGDLRRAGWDDLNLPARLGTYAAAGLPWILRDNAPSRVALQRLAEQHGVGVQFRDFAHLAELLKDRDAMARRTDNMRAARLEFAFDSHVDELIEFFRGTIARRRAGREYTGR